VFAPNHKLRSAVTALAIGNVGKRRDAAAGGHAAGGDTNGDRCDSCDKPRSHDASRIAWAKLMARVGEEFPLECPGCGGDIRLIAFITDLGPIRKILTHLGEPLEPPPISPARGPPTDWGELVQVHDDRSAPLGRRLPKCPWPTYPLTVPAPANPFARALLAAADPDARKQARKSLDRRQAVDTTSTATSGKPGRQAAGGLTKEKSFGRANSSAPQPPSPNGREALRRVLAILPQPVWF